MRNKSYKISGQVSQGVLIVGSLIGLALLGVVYLKTQGNYLSFGDKKGLLAQISQPAWVTKAPMPLPRSSPAGGVSNGVLYVVGGNDGTRDSASLQAYDPSSNTWKVLASMPGGRYGGNGAGVEGNNIFVAGGWTTSPGYPNRSLFSYNIIDNVWHTTLASMPTLSACGSTGVINGKLYITTACDGDAGYRNFLHVWDPATNAWSALASSPNAHVNPVSGVINGKLYVAGGLNADEAVSATLDVYDPVTNSWSTLAPMLVARSGAAGTVVNGKLYVAGGVGRGGNLNTVEVYDPATNTWTDQPPMSSSRVGAVAGNINNVLYVAGGDSTNSTVEALDLSGSKPPAGSLTVTVPNGGETWQIGSIHTIQWTPYDPQSGVNVVPTVSAYLEKEVNGSFVTVGKIIESGKASIHWAGDLDDYGKYPEPGNYYVRVVNSQTGQSDRSDSYFKVVATGTVRADLSINKSKGPISLPGDGDNVLLSWTSSNASSCDLYFNGLADDLKGLSIAGEKTIFLKQNPYQYESVVSVVCESAIGSAGNGVGILPYSKEGSYVKITYPNGGENLSSKDSINWNFSSDINKFSIALYKNDAFFKWIASDLPWSGPGLLSWNPSGYASSSDIGRQVFKIYIIGYKSAGGTVEDKSDAPFTITAPAATGPTLTISVSTAPPAQTIIAGSNQVEFARYILDASTSGEDIKINPYLPLKYTVVSDNLYDGATHGIFNCRLYDGNASISNASNAPIFSSSGYLAFWFYSDVGQDFGTFIIPKGTVKQLSLRCDVRATATGSYQWGYEDTGSGRINVPGMPQIYGVTSEKKAVVTSINNPGQKMTAISGGALSVSLDSVAPYQIVSPGQTVELARLKFSATGEDVAVKQVALQLSSPELNTSADLVDQTVTLWDGATQVGTAIFANGDTAIFSAIINFTVPKDGFKALSVKGTIANISVSGPLTKSGDLLKVDYDGDNKGLNGTYGVGQSSGMTITPSGSDTNSTGVRIMKAYPSLEKINLSSSERTLVAGDNRPLYKFKITANKDALAIYKFTFYNGGSQYVGLSRIGLYVFNDSSYSVPDGNFSSSVNPGGLLNCDYLTGQITPQLEIIPRKSCPGSSPTVLVIPAGESRYFELTASIDLTKLTSLGVNVVQTQLEGDAATPTVSGGNFNVDMATLESDINNDFLWSPEVGTAVLGVNDYRNVGWTNGYGVPGLPSTNMAPETLTSSALGCIASTSCTSQYCQYGGNLQTCAVTNSDCSTSSYTTGSCNSPAAACDATAKAVLDAAGGCSQINSSQYPSVYKACCSLVPTTTVTKETLLGLLNGALQDGVISDQEKADLLKALNDYLF